jgi:hypothetical protein
MAGRGMAWLVKAWSGVARHGLGSTGSGPLAVACGCERTGDGPGRGRARQGAAWRGLARPGEVGRGEARQGQYGLRPVAGIEGCLERTGDGSRLGRAWRGVAGRGKGSNQALALGGRLHQRSNTGGTLWKAWNLADHLAQASRLMGGISIRRNRVKR